MQQAGSAVVAMLGQHVAQAVSSTANAAAAAAAAGM
jgi:hypothetical protein